MNNDTIAAIATPPGAGGIGIIRISGPEAFSIVQRFFKRTAGFNEAANAPQISHLPASHSLTHGYIVDPQSNQIIDEILLAVMQAPRSYTKEDVVEIQCHAGQAVLNTILELVLQNGARPAQPGEFTRRAFLNGRIDLSQAEAVADLINAKNSRSVGLAASHLAGAMKAKIDGFIEILTQTLMQLEASIEFPDEVDFLPDHRDTINKLRTQVLNPLSQMVQDHKSAQIIREGFRLTIVGRPNVGKSSLLNRLVCKDKAIVTPIPGTTRDLVEDFIFIQNIPVLLTDTAGLHETPDPIEGIGIQKALENAENSDLILFVQDATQPDHPEDYKLLAMLSHLKCLRVVNKCDLLTSRQTDTLWPPKPSNSAMVILSALKGEGIEKLKQEIAAICSQDIHLHSNLMPNLRQNVLLSKSVQALNRALEALHASTPDELIVYDLSETLESLKEITGQKWDADLLDRIFEHFCIGK